LGQPLADEVAVGTYDYLSSLSHPTLYAHAQMWTVAETASDRRVESSVIIEDQDKQARIALVPYYETLTDVTHYNGWPAGSHDRLTAAMDRLLPGVFTESVKLSNWANQRSRGGRCSPLLSVSAAASTGRMESTELAIHFATPARLWRWLCGGFSGEPAVGVGFGLHRALQESVEEQAPVA
jgi:hypothetical protein